MGELSVLQIKEYLTNRYPYLLIDKITELVPGASARGYKNLTANEWYFPVHFPEKPMMPGMIQMESLLQMLSLTVLSLDENKGKAIRVLSASKIRLKKRVEPGNRMDIVAELISFKDGKAEGKAKGFINDEIVCEGEFVFTMA